MKLRPPSKRGLRGIGGFGEVIENITIHVPFNSLGIIIIIQLFRSDWSDYINTPPPIRLKKLAGRLSRLRDLSTWPIHPIAVRLLLERFKLPNQQRLYGNNLPYCISTSSDHIVLPRLSVLPVRGRSMENHCRYVLKTPKCRTQPWFHHYHLNDLTVLPDWTSITLRWRTVVFRFGTSG